MWISDLLAKVDYSSFYPAGKNVGTNERNVNCPFHNDAVASLSINLVNGVYFCHACGEKGNLITWCKHHNIDLKKLAEDYGVKTTEKIVSNKVVEEAHDKLLKEPKALDFLKNIRGISLDTVKRFKLGFHNGRLAIPITNVAGKYINVRLYSSKAKTSAKVMSFGSGYGAAAIYPIENLSKPDILLCEGELDCLIANDLGFNAITITGGAQTWKREWNTLFLDKDVAICYDVDAAGRQGSHKIAEELKNYANTVKVIHLPISTKEIPNGDLTDYIISMGCTGKDLETLINKTPHLKTKEEDDEKYCAVSLHEASRADYNNVQIQFTALISGKDIQPYLVPRKIKALCGQNAGSACEVCRLQLEHGEYEFEIEKKNLDLLSFLDNDNNKKNAMLRNFAHIPSRCKAQEFQTIESYNVERIVLIPEIEFTSNIDDDSKYVTRVAYYLGHKIDTNKVYNFKGITVSHPQTQQATHMLWDAEPALTAIESFKFSKNIFEELTKFQSEDPEEQLRKIYENTVVPITGIKQRIDLFIAMLLTYTSPLTFKFDNRLISKGWLETLILGDTRTGKTEMAKKLIEYFKIGELVLGESASFAGLIGGVQQLGSRWHLNWGRVPLNNGRLVFIDEMSGLQTWEIAKMSGIRSSGIAEITKIRTERTAARTRLIWMSNVRGTNSEQRDISAYTQGIRAVPELVGKPEDISRFDIVVIVDKDEVPTHIINQPIEQLDKPVYTSDDFHNLIIWAWKLRSDNIIIEEDAEKKIYEYAEKMGRKYSQSIPVVVSSEQRIKIARVSTAIAAAMFSTDDGKKLIVTLDHVDFAVKYIERILDKPACAYDEYSRLEKGRLEITNKENIKKMLSTNIIDQLLTIDKFIFTDLQDIFGLSNRSEARDTINNLIYNQAIRRTGSQYEKTPAFIKFIREVKFNNNKPTPVDLDEQGGEQGEWWHEH